MKFSCEKAILQSAINTVSRAVALKSTVSSLEGILIESKNDNSIQLTGSKLDTGITTLIDAEIQKEGSIVVPSRVFVEIIKSLPDDIVTVEERENRIINIVCGDSVFDLPGGDPYDYPEFPKIDRENKLTIEQEKLKHMISQVIFAASTGDSKPIHAGVLFEIENQYLNLVAVDGYRLALRREKIIKNEEEEKDKVSFIIAGATLSEVEKICSDTKDEIAIVVGSRHVMFQVENTILITRQMEGEFLDYRKTIPKKESFSIKVETKSIRTLIERASLIIVEKLKSPVKCIFEDGSLSMMIKTPIGAFYDCCKITGNGNKMEIGFNNIYLLDAVKAAPTEEIMVKIIDPFSPCLIVPPDETDDSFLYMVLPVRLKAGG